MANITGIGIDIVSIERFRVLKNPLRFAEFFLTKNERDEALHAPDISTHYASRFAAKEAVIKAMSGKVTAMDFEIRKKDKSPYVHWCDPGHNHHKALVSISHEEAYAVANACVIVDGD